MALLNHRMSTVLGIDASVFTRRVAPKLAENESLGCPKVPPIEVQLELPDSIPDWLKLLIEGTLDIDPHAGVESLCVGIGTCARFVPFAGGVAYQQPLSVDIVLFASAGGGLADVAGSLPIRCEILVNIKLQAAMTNGNLTLTAQYVVSPDEVNDPSVLVTVHGPDAIAEPIEAAIRALIQGGSGGTPPQNVTIPLGPIGTALGANPVVAMRAQDGRAVGSTLMIGIGRASDPNVDAAAFVASTTPFVATEDWAIEVEDDLVEAVVTTVAAGQVPAFLTTPNTISLPIDGNTTLTVGTLSPVSAVAFWNGAPTPAGGMAGELGFVQSQHAIWISFSATFQPDANVPPIPFGLLVEGDFRVVDGALRFEYRPFRYQVGLFEFAAEDLATLLNDPQFAAVTAMALAAGDDQFVPTTTGFTPDRLSIGGRDTAAPFRGPPRLEPLSAVEVTNEPQGCSRRLAFDDDVDAEVIVRNTGHAPLWVCGMSFEEGAPFAVNPAAGTFPRMVPARSAQVMLVTYTGAEGTSAAATMTVRTNDCTQPVVEVPVTGQYHTADTFFPGAELCIREDEIPEPWPEGWFEGVTRLSERLTEEMPSDDGVILTLRVEGISASEAIWASSEVGTGTQPTMRVGPARLLRARIGSAAPTVFATTATRWEGPARTRIALAGEDVVARVPGAAPRELLATGAHVLARHDDHVAVYVASRSERGITIDRTGEFAVPAGAAWGAVPGAVWFAQDDAVQQAGLGDAAPRSRPILALAGRAAFAVPGGFALVDGRRVERYEPRAGGVHLSDAWTAPATVGAVVVVDGSLGFWADDALQLVGARGDVRAVARGALPAAAAATLRPRATTQSWIGDTLLVAGADPKHGVIAVRPAAGRWQMDHREAAAILGLPRAGKAGGRRLLVRAPD